MNDQDLLAELELLAQQYGALHVEMVLQSQRPEGWQRTCTIWITDQYGQRMSARPLGEGRAADAERAFSDAIADARST